MATTDYRNHPSYAQYGDGRAVIWTKDGPSLDLKACTFEPLPADVPPSPSEWWQRLTFPQRARVLIGRCDGCYNLSETFHRAVYQPLPLMPSYMREVIEEAHRGLRKR